MAKSLADTVANWTNSAPAAQANYVKGIQSSTKPIVSSAIAAQGAMVANFNASVTSGRWANKLAAVGDGGIKKAAVDKAANFSNGLTQGKDNFQKAMQTWLPIIESVSNQTNQMPSGTLAASIARVSAQMTALHNAKLQGA